MELGKACVIFLNIDSPEFSDEEKGTAIYKVLKMETHNGITKAALMKALWWLLNLAFEIPEPELKTNQEDRSDD